MPKILLYAFFVFQIVKILDQDTSIIIKIPIQRNIFFLFYLFLVFSYSRGAIAPPFLIKLSFSAIELLFALKEVPIENW